MRELAPALLRRGLEKREQAPALHGQYTPSSGQTSRAGRLSGRSPAIPVTVLGCVILLNLDVNLFRFHCVATETTPKHYKILETRMTGLEPATSGVTGRRCVEPGHVITAARKGLTAIRRSRRFPDFTRISDYLPPNL